MISDKFKQKSRGLNIAIISPEFYPFTSWGGVANFNDNLSMMLAKNGHQVHVITFDGRGNSEKETKRNGVFIHYIKLKSDSKLFNFIYYKFPVGIIRSFFRRYLPELIFTLDWNIFVYFYFRKLTKKYHFNIIHSPTYYLPAAIIKLFNRSIVNIIHVHGLIRDFNKFNVNNLESKLRATLESYYLRFLSDKIIPCSDGLKRKLNNYFPKLKEKIYFIPNFINISEFNNNNLLNRNNIVYYGKVEKRKGVDLLIKSFSSLAKNYKQIKLFIIGEDTFNLGENNTHISVEEFINTLKIQDDIKKRIFILPKINDRKALMFILKNLKGVMVLPSRYDPFAAVMLESMALGSLLIASDSGGGSEIITNKVGILIHSSIKSLKAGLIKAIDMNNKKVDLITSNAKRYVNQKHSFQIIVKKYEKLYFTIFNKTNGVIN